MNRGFSLLEFLAASALFIIVVLGGYEFLDREVHLHTRLLRITRPEAGMNYRMIVVRSFFGGITRPLDLDPVLAAAPAAFPDVQFGEAPEARAFSVACPTGKSERFLREGSSLKVAGAEAIKPGTVLLLAGADAADAYCWNYARVDNVTASGADQYLECTSLTHHDSPDIGSLIPVQLQGLAFRDGRVYWVQPSGEWSPFLDVDDFHSSVVGRLLRIEWKIAETNAAFQVQL